jgi:hypothetical protein
MCYLVGITAKMTATDADWVVLKNNHFALPKDLTVSPTQGADRTNLQGERFFSALIFPRSECSG